MRSIHERNPVSSIHEQERELRRNRSTTIRYRVILPRRDNRSDEGLDSAASRCDDGGRRGGGVPLALRAERARACPCTWRPDRPAAPRDVGPPGSRHALRRPTYSGRRSQEGAGRLARAGPRRRPQGCGDAAGRACPSGGAFGAAAAGAAAAGRRARTSSRAPPEAEAEAQADADARANAEADADAGPRGDTDPARRTLPGAVRRAATGFCRRLAAGACGQPEQPAGIVADAPGGNAPGRAVEAGLGIGRPEPRSHWAARAGRAEAALARRGHAGRPISACATRFFPSAFAR